MLKTQLFKGIFLLDDKGNACFEFSNTTKYFDKKNEIPRIFHDLGHFP